MKALGVITLIGLIVLPFAWGYEQRQQARTWQNIACAYRIREVASRVPLFEAASQARDACETLERMGLDLEFPKPSGGRRAAVSVEATAARTN